MAKNLKNILKIFTTCRYDLQSAMNNILYSLNNVVSSNSKYPINARQEANFIRKRILGDDFDDLDYTEDEILQNMAVSWASKEQSHKAVYLFMRQHNPGKSRGNIVDIIQETKPVWYEKLGEFIDQPINNNLHILMDREFYDDEGKSETADNDGNGSTDGGKDTSQPFYKNPNYSKYGDGIYGGAPTGGAGAGSGGYSPITAGSWIGGGTGISK
jgi:hypothetical protein